jgi:hypothetical protein
MALLHAQLLTAPEILKLSFKYKTFFTDVPTSTGKFIIGQQNSLSIQTILCSDELEKIKFPCTTVC